MDGRRYIERRVIAGHGGSGNIISRGGSGTIVRPSGGYVYYEEDMSNGQVIDVTDRYVAREPARRTVHAMRAPVKTLTTNGSIISAEPSLITLPRQKQEKIVTRVLPANHSSQRVRRVVQSPVVVPQGGYRTLIDSSRGVIRTGGQQVVREVMPRYAQKPQVVQQVVRRSAPSKKYYVTNSTDYTSSSDSSSSDSDDDDRTLISKGEVVHAVIRDNWTFKKDPVKEEKTKVKKSKEDANDDAASSASSSSLESRKLKILEQVRDNGVENGQVIVNDNGTPVIVKMRSNKKEKKVKKGRKKEEGKNEAEGATRILPED